jgi:hypothetical protein
MIAPDFYQPGEDPKKTGRFDDLERNEVTRNPDKALALAKGRLRQFDAVIPVSKIFDGLKYLSYIMRLPLPKKIESVRALRSVCRQYVSNFTDEFEAAFYQGLPFNCNGRRWACYTAENDLMRKQHPDKYENVVSGHSPRVSDHVRAMNSLDDELHRFSTELWEMRWTHLTKLEGEPKCEVTCRDAKTKALCTKRVSEFEKRYGISFDSDEFRSLGMMLVMQCEPTVRIENGHILEPYCFDN